MKVALFLLVALLVGCAGQAVQPEYYLLRSDQQLPSGKLRTSAKFSLGTVEIAPYLDQPGLVLETAGGTMNPANQHLWAEPIYNSVRNFLDTEIAQAYGQELLPSNKAQNTTAVEIRIDQLHGTTDGKAHIVAYWWLVQNDKVSSLYRFSDSRNLQTSGYSALVDAEKALLEALAIEIAASLPGSAAELNTTP